MTDDPASVPTQSVTVVLLRADAVALMEGYQTNRGVTLYYRGDPLIERVRDALGMSEQESRRD